MLTNLITQLRMVSYSSTSTTTLCSNECFGTNNVRMFFELREKRGVDRDKR